MLRYFYVLISFSRSNILKLHIIIIITFFLLLNQELTYWHECRYGHISCVIVKTIKKKICFHHGEISFQPGNKCIIRKRSIKCIIIKGCQSVDDRNFENFLNIPLRLKPTRTFTASKLQWF